MKFNAKIKRKKVVDPARLGIALTINNIVSAGVSFVGTILLTSHFGLDNIGYLGIIVSATMIISPFVQFRLDLAFERFSKYKKASLVAAVQIWALIVGLISIAIGSLFCLLFSVDYLAVAIFSGINIIFSNCANITWAKCVSERNIASVMVLQLGRSIFGIIFPFALSPLLPPSISLLMGSSLAGIVFIIFVPPIHFYQFTKIIKTFHLLLRSFRDLVIDNTIPVLINICSIYLAPILVSYAFGMAEAGVMYLIFRLIITPSQLIADPIRRSVYAHFPRVDLISYVSLKKIGTASIIFALISLFGFVLGIIMHGIIQNFIPLVYAPYYFALLISCAWGGLIIGNASLTGLIPTLAIAPLQSKVEAFGLVARLSALSLGLLGFSFLECLYVFVSITIAINLVWSAIIYFICLRRIGKHKMS